MRFATLALFSLVSTVFAGNCGPENKNAKCSASECCSQYGWCGTTKDHCDAKTCLKNFSGASSQCKSGGSSTPPPQGGQNFPATVPEIDVCGHAENGVSCPGAGTNGYFYRCCSSAGHCGPKNDIQDQGIYCGADCQGGFGKCNTMAKPPVPAQAPGIARAGETCGPIVNKKCADNLCCSGSNFCGTGEDFCGSNNWCQSKWGKCN
ncbi:hypothetical protein IAQ61_008967 [Plenodomus lingam]|uniref:Chitin-binding type-1 domain-containing protein n=1 Tax=Leptosphaeria maculans (strain JN3 / isolate v23.1.3 / race Av1-4-5-6-7-8) TaxID=985895 RepID=E4ZNN4_LEPMJ|nr:hypothetical protein LEMA_P041540.1 [Plenodomus lingam JN3]KAH9865021.1 hypothetical protein IAQ61_008967 [Plenodomus lingam]CBX93253.1 hypothetical protein LEMA_P041540.1 [Plenodomus lingam JN3]